MTVEAAAAPALISVPLAHRAASTQSNTDSEEDEPCADNDKPLDWPPEKDVNEGEFQVFKILDHRLEDKKTGWVFLVKWRGWGPSYNSWEPVNCFLEPYDKLKRYISKVPELLVAYEGKAWDPLGRPPRKKLKTSQKSAWDEDSRLDENRGTNDLLPAVSSHIAADEGRPAENSEDERARKREQIAKFSWKEMEQNLTPRVSTKAKADINAGSDVSQPIAPRPNRDTPRGSVRKKVALDESTPRTVPACDDGPLLPPSPKKRKITQEELFQQIEADTQASVKARLEAEKAERSKALSEKGQSKKGQKRKTSLDMAQKKSVDVSRARTASVGTHDNGHPIIAGKGEPSLAEATSKSDAMRVPRNGDAAYKDIAFKQSGDDEMLRAQAGADSTAPLTSAPATEDVPAQDRANNVRESPAFPHEAHLPSKRIGSYPMTPSPRKAQDVTSVKPSDRAKSSVSRVETAVSMSRKPSGSTSAEQLQSTVAKTPPARKAAVAAPQRRASAQDASRRSLRQYARMDAQVFAKTRKNASWLIENMGSSYKPPRPQTPLDTESALVAHIWSRFHSPEDEMPCIGDLACLARPFADRHGIVHAFIYASKSIDDGTGARGKADRCVLEDVNALSYCLLAAKLTQTETDRETVVGRIEQMPNLPDSDAATADETILTFIHSTDTARLQHVRELDAIRQGDGPFCVFGARAGTQLIFVQDAAVTCHSSVLIKHPDLFARIVDGEYLHAWCHPGLLAPDGPFDVASSSEVHRQVGHQMMLAITQLDRPLHLLVPHPAPLDNNRVLANKLLASCDFPLATDTIDPSDLVMQPPLPSDAQEELATLLSMCKSYMGRYLSIRRWIVVVDEGLLGNWIPSGCDEESVKQEKTLRLGPAELMTCHEFTTAFL